MSNNPIAKTIPDDLTAEQLIGTVEPNQLFNSDNINALIEQTAHYIAAFEHDMTTAKGRKATASLANKVARLKTSIDNIGKDMVSGWKAKAKEVDDMRRYLRNELDSLKIIAREPLTQLEDKEAAYQQSISQTKSLLSIRLVASADLTQAQVAAETKRIESTAIPEGLDEDISNELITIQRASLYQLGAMMENAKPDEPEVQPEPQPEPETPPWMEQAKPEPTQSAGVTINRDVQPATAKADPEREHQAQVHRAITTAIYSQIIGIDEARAKALVIAIVKGQIPHLNINY